MLMEPLKSNAVRMQTARGFSVPPPVGGLNAKSALADMPEEDAIELTNIFPEENYVSVRNGYGEHTTDIGSAASVDTLFSYNGPAGVKLFCATSSGIYSASSSGSAASAVYGSITNGRFQYTNFATAGGNFLVAVNGVDTCLKYDNSAWSTNSITGTGLTATNLISVVPHKKRLWFIEKNSAKAWYLGTEAISGAAKKFPLGSVFQHGGYLQGIGTLSRDAGDGIDDYLCFISSIGEVAIYQGTDPASASTWELVGVFRMGEPIGWRCTFKYGGDLVCITIDGVTSVGKLIVSDRASKDAVYISDKINPLLNAAARLYKDNFGWEGIVYPKGRWVLINVPEAESTQSVQYVMNTVTGSWCKFTNMSANCWGLFDDDIYFGGSSIVYKADDGLQDDGANINAVSRSAFNYFKSRGQQKKFTLMRPIISSNGTPAIALSLNTDFSNAAMSSSPPLTPSQFSSWGTAVWQSSQWSNSANLLKDWQTIGAIGMCASIRMDITINGQYADINSFDIMAEVGGPI